MELKNLNLLPLFFVMLLVAACTKGKDVKILDGGANAGSGSSATPVLEGTGTTTTADDTKPAPNALPEEKFCDKGQTYKMDISLNTDFLDYKGKLWVSAGKGVTHKQVKAYFQEGQPIKKDHLDKNKVFCEITAHVNPKIGKRSYKIVGAIASAAGEEKVENQSICRQEMVDLSGIKNGTGLFTEVACTKIDDTDLRIEDVKDAMGESSITISGAIK